MATTPFTPMLPLVPDRLCPVAVTLHAMVRFPFLPCLPLLNRAAPGNTNEICGGGYALSLYTYGGGVVTQPGYPPGWSTTTKCVSDYTQRRRYLECTSPSHTPSLIPPHDVCTDFAASSSTMTSESCVTMCDAAGYNYAGTENANECHCSNDPDPFNGGDPATCDMACVGEYWAASYLVHADWGSRQIE